MPAVSVWNIHRPDGRYVGQSAAFAAPTAFCKYMSVTGIQTEEGDVEFESIDEDRGRIVHGSGEFIMSRQGSE
jgi:hypothetical protein